MKCQAEPGNPSLRAFAPADPSTPRRVSVELDSIPRPDLTDRGAELSRPPGIHQTTPSQSCRRSWLGWWA